MIITNKYGTVNLDWKEHKKLILSFSGGSDSTLLMYLTMKKMQKMTDVTLQVITAVTPYKGKFKQFTSQENFDRMRREFNLGDRIYDRITFFNQTQEEIGFKCAEIQKKNNHDLTIFALTANPPYDIMEKYDLLRRRVEDRDPVKFMQEWYKFEDTMQYVPFRNVDKRWVAQCYQDFDLWRFYNNTISCERLRQTPDMLYSEEPCGHCWWCREKMMAFGMLDGGLKND